MIDRVARHQAAATTRHYVCGVVTNKEFEARFPYSKHDPIIHALDDTLWSTYEDISKHRLVGANAPPEWAKRRVARWLLFLYSDVEYEWPTIGNPGLRDLQRESQLWSDIRHSFGCLTSAEFFAHGDHSVWPFLRREDFENARRKPVLFNGNIEQIVGRERRERVSQLDSSVEA
jgi:hypothetical protein